MPAERTPSGQPEPCYACGQLAVAADPNDATHARPLQAPPIPLNEDKRWCSCEAVSGKHMVRNHPECMTAKLAPRPASDEQIADWVAPLIEEQGRAAGRALMRAFNMGWSQADGGVEITRLRAAVAKLETDLKEAVDALEEVMSSDSDMPTFDATQDRAEDVLNKHGRNS